MKQRTIIISSLIALVISFFIDKALVTWVSDNRITLLNEPMLWLTNIAFIFAVLIVMSAVFMWEEKKYEYIIPLILSFFIAIGAAYLLKYIIMRPRPAIELGITALTQKTSPAFPSAHAAAAFSAMGILDKEFPKEKYIWLIIAVIVAISRIYIGVHYLSDIIAGALLGYLIGLGIIRIEKKYKLCKSLTTQWKRN